MSAPITLFQDANGDLWYKHFKVDNLRFDETTRMGYLYGTDLAKSSTVLVSISAQPIIKSFMVAAGRCK
jgi:1,4-alpha-glucan branching enzyme